MYSQPSHLGRYQRSSPFRATRAQRLRTVDLGLGPGRRLARPIQASTSNAPAKPTQANKDPRPTSEFIRQPSSKASFPFHPSASLVCNSASKRASLARSSSSASSSPSARDRSVVLGEEKRGGARSARRVRCARIVVFVGGGAMVSFQMSDRKKIGLGLTGFGVFFSLLGIIMLFDKGFLAMGNILFVSGVLVTIGLKSTVQFFTKPKNHKGSISFGFGFFLVLIGCPILGMMVELYGFITLFSAFWPTAAVYLQKSPAFGWMFQHPFVTSLITRFRGRRVPV